MLAITSPSCSQASKKINADDTVVFAATTPSNDAVKNLFRIPPDFKTDMFRWNLTLDQNTKASSNSFDLLCTYGAGKQGTRGFTDGAKTIELKGKYSIDKANKETIYNLVDDNKGISLSFLAPDKNLLHLLNNDKQMMVGTGAWSFTLNRVSPSSSENKFSLKPVSKMYVASDSASFGVFLGRLPCDDALRELHEISSQGCDIVKVKLTLYLDSKTHEPTTFLLNTIYVGNGDDNIHKTTGKWKLLQDTNYDPTALFFQLEPDSSKNTFTLWKADNNNLFFLDKNNNFLVGSEYTSYTLSRH